MGREGESWGWTGLLVSSVSSEGSSVGERRARYRDRHTLPFSAGMDLNV